VTDNPNRASLVQGWKLFGILCSAFAPTRSFQEYLCAFVAKHFHDPHEVAYLAPFAYWRLEKTILMGADALTYTPEQMDHWLEKGVPSNMVLFGGSIDYIMSLQKAEGHNEPVPYLMVRLIDTITEMGGRTIKGMFRIAADRGETLALKEQIENGSYEIKCSSPHVAGDLLKIWLRELSEPLIPQRYYEECLGMANDKQRALDFCNNTLPPSHRAVLDYLIKFLKHLVENEKENAMSSENVAIVFCQNMLRNRENDCDPNAVLKNSNREKAFVKTLIENWP